MHINYNIYKKEKFTYILGAFAKLRKATISFVMSVCPPASPSVRIEQLRSHWTDFNAIMVDLWTDLWTRQTGTVQQVAQLHERYMMMIMMIFEYFSNNRPENSSSIKIWQELRVLYMKTNLHFWSYLAQFFLEWKMF